MRRVFTFLVALALFGMTAPVLADVPTEMSVQGRLTNGAGAPVPAGLKNFTFKIWDAAAGGTEIWPAGPGELQTLTTDANGLWNAGVGQIIPLTEAVFLSPVRWLEVTVDDGVNPIETLPRIELRTNPYTYRAATSQQADSIAGNSLGDLVNQFVDEAADTMSGPLRIDWNASDIAASLELQNINNAFPVRWPTASGTWGAAAQAAGNSGPWNVGVAGAAQGHNMANYGVYGAAEGDNSQNIALWGEAYGTGSSNYAGVFNGDVVVYGSSPGDASVQLPANAISASEILDEPGLAKASAFGGISLTTSMTDLVTVTITIPNAGYIELLGEIGELDMSGTTGSNWAWVQIDTASGQAISSSRSVVVGAWAFPTTGFFFHASMVSQVYYKASAGTYTFRLAAAKVAAPGTITPYYNRLRALYIPTSYGTVAASVAANEAGSFENVNTVGVSATGAHSDEGVLREVDLRELELKVKRAELLAETARRELVEAQLNGIRNSERSRTGEPQEDHR